MSLEDTLGDADAVAQDLYARADAPSQGSVDSDLKKSIEDRIAVPLEQRPLYKAGKSIQEFGERTFPLTDEEKTWAGPRIAGGVTGMAPAMLLTVGGTLLGVPELGLAAGALQMGAQSAGSSFQRALDAGATYEEAAHAAQLDGVVGLGLGVLPLGAIFDPIRVAGGTGLVGFAMQKLEQAIKSGATFATVAEAQKFLSSQIASQYNASAREKLRTIKRSWSVRSKRWKLAPVGPHRRRRRVFLICVGS